MLNTFVVSSTAGSRVSHRDWSSISSIHIDFIGMIPKTSMNNRVWSCVIPIFRLINHIISYLIMGIIPIFRCTAHGLWEFRYPHIWIPNMRWMTMVTSKIEVAWPWHRLNPPKIITTSRIRIEASETCFYIFSNGLHNTGSPKHQLHVWHVFVGDADHGDLTNPRSSPWD